MKLLSGGRLDEVQIGMRAGKHLHAAWTLFARIERVGRSNRAEQRLAQVSARTPACRSRSGQRKETCSPTARRQCRETARPRRHALQFRAKASLLPDFEPVLPNAFGLRVNPQTAPPLVVSLPALPPPTAPVHHSNLVGFSRGLGRKSMPRRMRNSSPCDSIRSVSRRIRSVAACGSMSKTNVTSGTRPSVAITPICQSSSTSNPPAYPW